MEKRRGAYDIKFEASNNSLCPLGCFLSAAAKVELIWLCQSDKRNFDEI